jgi:hypothetical protein
MKKIALSIAMIVALTSGLWAGSEYSGKEIKQVVPPPCPEWYADTEWNASLWGTYVFTAENWEEDEYIKSDHAWGGGVDLKYFFHRYFGVGVEGWAIDARRERFEGIQFVVGDGSFPVFGHEDRLVGAVKGTITLRYPFRCSRFAPYIYGGAGAIFGGGERDFLPALAAGAGGIGQFVSALHSDGDTQFLGQIGAGLEVRLTRHIGWINDFSWNFVARDNSDFGMVRSGINFAF